MRGEELPGRGGSPLLALEEHGRTGRGQGEDGGDRQPLERERLREPVARGAVADLVVILREGDQAPGRHLGGIGRPWSRPRKDEYDPSWKNPPVQTFGRASTAAKSS